MYATLFRFLGQVPEEFKRGEDAEYLMSVARRCAHHLVNLAYRPISPEGALDPDQNRIRLYTLEKHGPNLSLTKTMSG